MILYYVPMNENIFLIKPVPLSEERHLCFYSGNERVVVVPDGVTLIQTYAFADSEHPNNTIEKIILPSSVNRIEDDAFSFCKALKEIQWPDNDFLFLSCNPFEGCDSLEKLTIPKSVTKIARFRIPKNLKEIIVHDDLDVIGQSAFCYETDDRITGFDNLITIETLLKNPTYKIIGGFMVNTKHNIALFCVDRSKSEITVPDGIETIGANAFDDYGYFEVNYKKNGYMGNEKVPVERIIIPSSVKNIDNAAFFYCRQLKEVIYEGNSSDLNADNAFLECDEMSYKSPQITCSDTIKKKKKTTHLMMERIVLIHRIINSGSHPNTEKIRQIVNAEFGLINPKEQFSLSTISRDLEFLRIRFDAPLEYDRTTGGYLYTSEFELKF